MEKIKDKLLFCSLVFLYIFFLFTTFKFTFFLITPKLNELSPFLVSLINNSLNIFFLLLLIKLLFTILSSVLEKKIAFFPKAEHKYLYLLAKLALGLGSLLGITKEKTLRSFFAFNNSLVKLWKLDKARKPLLLLPRCLQHSECPQKVTEDIMNCKQCQKCNLAQICQVKEEYNFDIHVVSGGELAKKILLEKNPSFIIAVACENELLVNIRDIPPYPIIGLTNERPHGPCKDTLVNIDKLKKYISRFAIPKK